MAAGGSLQHECPSNRDQETYVALLVNTQNDMVIVHRTSNRLCFPLLASPEIPWDGQKMSECFSQRFKQMCGTKYELVFLYSTRNEIYSVGTPHTAIFEVLSPIDPTNGESIQPTLREYVWMSQSTVHQLFEQPKSPSMLELCEHSTLQALRRINRQNLTKDELRLWQVPGWHSETVMEATKALKNLGYDLKDAFEQVSITPNSAVLRAETVKGRVYLKASNCAEGTVTSLVAGFAPELVQKPIFVNKEKKWMLMNDYGEEMEDEEFMLLDYEKLCVPLGKLHLESLKHIEALKDAGVPCESAESLIRRIRRIIEDQEFRRTLGKCKGFETDAKDGMADLQECYEPLGEFLRDLYENECFPLALVHGDVHKGNIIKAGDGSYVVFDWGCARIDLPFSDIMCLRGQVSPVEEQERISMESYFNLWKEYASLPKLQSLCSSMDLKRRLSMSLEGFESAISNNASSLMDPNDVLALVYVLADIMTVMEEK